MDLWNRPLVDFFDGFSWSALTLADLTALIVFALLAVTILIAGVVLLIGLFAMSSSSDPALGAAKAQKSEDE